MPVVPFGPTSSPQPSTPTPDDTFVMMAAAQMHTEGRLVKPKAKIPPAVQSFGLSKEELDLFHSQMDQGGLRPAKPGAEEWETVHRVRETGESGIDAFSSGWQKQNERTLMKKYNTTSRFDI